MNQYLITALIDIAVGVFAFSKTQNRAARALGLTALSLGIWSLELYLLTKLENEDVLDLWFHVTRWGMFFIPPCFALLAWQLVAERSTLFKKIVVIPGFLVATSISFSNLFLFRTELEATSSGFLPKIDTIYFAFIGLFLWCFLGSIFLAATCHKSASQREKNRVKWLLITLLVSFLGGAANIFLMPNEFYLSKYMGSVLNIVFVVLLLYSTVQHHLMDFRLALSVGISRAILLCFFVWVFFLYTSLSGSLEENSGALVLLAGLMVVMMELYPRLLKWILPNAKRLIAKNSYDVNSVLDDASRALNGCTNYGELTKVCEYLFYQVLKLDSYRLITNSFDSDKEQLYLNDLVAIKGFCSNKLDVVFTDEAPPEISEILKKHKAAAVMCIKFGNESVGLLFVGLYEGLNYYRYDDIKMFEWVQAELGRVINRIRQVDEMYDQLGQAKKTLSMLGLMNHYHHDIKAPFTIIDGVLSNDIYDKDRQKDIVLEQVERGSKLITTMANILKGERKRKVSPVSLQDVVDDSVFLLSQGLDKVSCELSDVPRLMADAEDLKILVINVIKNAVEARRDGVALVVKVRAVQTETHLVLSFSDTGKGMSESLVERLWDDVESDKDGGSGIGTQAIKRIADEHFADIEVKSTVGFGSEFIFKFPLSLVVNEDEQEQENELKASVGLSSKASLSLRAGK